MKRLHINVAVEDMAASVRFYSTLFAAEPAVLKPDYAKWMLEDPRVNFAIMAGGGVGIDHLGIQTESEEELRDMQRRLAGAERPVLDQGRVTCCYAKSEKSWVTDPQGIAWEAFLTHESVTFGADGDGAKRSTAACCTPAFDRASDTSAAPNGRACC